MFWNYGMENYDFSKTVCAKKTLIFILELLWE